MLPYNTNRRKQSKPQHQAVWQNERSWIKGVAWGIGGVLIALISCFGWFISTFKDNLAFALTEAIRQVIGK